MKKKVLIMTGYYLPSVKGGGPIQSIKNLVENLSDRIDFYILTSDRDLGDSKPFDNIQTDSWITVGKAKVYYIYNKKITPSKLISIIKDLKIDIIYLNSYFSFRFSIIPIILKRFRLVNNRIILAPRGQFSTGALGLKSIKKRLYVVFSKKIGFYNNINWHATTEIEKLDIQSVLGNHNITIATNLTPNYANFGYKKMIRKKPNELKLVYIARIHPMKNLLQILNILKDVHEGNIIFNIYGPIEDQKYWDECIAAISELGTNIKVAYHGQIQNDQVLEVYNNHHIAILLTLGENFGHSISEALLGGCPLIISDKTPWRNIDGFNCGWDIPLNRNDIIIDKLKFFVKLDQNEYNAMSLAAFNYGKGKSNNAMDLNAYYSLFDVNEI